MKEMKIMKAMKIMKGVKTTKIIFRVLVCCLIFLYAQDSAAQFAANERSINGRVFMYSGSTIHNKKNLLESDLHCRDFGLREIEPVSQIYDKVFSEERVKELKDVRFDLEACCDSSGSILEVNFSMGEHLSKITQVPQGRHFINRML
jgi:hypothetical protein